MDEDRLEIRRRLAAPPERVYAAWTDARLLARWMSPLGHARVTVDPRVGGQLRIVMVGDGREIEHTGEFIEVDPPHRLSFTWQSSYTADQPSRVTVELEAREGGTELRLVHELLPPGAAVSHAGGWRVMVDRLGVLMLSTNEEAAHATR